MILTGSPKVFIKRTCLAALLLACLFTSGCLRRAVARKMSETEARELAVTLTSANIRSYVTKEIKDQEEGDDQWDVEINGGDATESEARRILHENGLPRPRDTGIPEIYPKGSDLVPTPTEDHARFIAAISGELNRSLKSIACVADARVQVVIPDTSELRDPADRPQSSAAVILTHWSSCSPPSEEEISAFVANGIEGLDKKRVSVMYVEREQATQQTPKDLLAIMRPTPALIVDYGKLYGLIAVCLTLSFGLLTSLKPIVKWIKNTFRDLSGK
jgi:type III secretion protein J